MKMSIILSLLVMSQITQSFGGETFTWNAVVQEASRSNSELKAAESSLNSSKYQINSARSGFFPIISANAGVFYDSTNSPKNSSMSLLASENIFSGFSDSSKLAKAKFTSSSSEASLDNVKAKVSYDLKSAYMGLVYSQKYITLTEDIIKRREANLKLVQLRFESGRENMGSLYLSRAYLAQAKYEHLQAMNSLEIYQSELARVLGREDHVNLQVEGMVPVTKPPYDNNQNINFRELVPNLPEFRKAYFDTEIAKANLDLSKSTFYPVLNLNQSATRTDRENAPLNNSWSVGAVLTFPLFNGGKDYYAVKSASEDYTASALLKKNTEENSMTKLKDAYTKYVESVMKLEVDEAFVLAAITREKIAKAQYNNGLISFTDWDTIENDLINRQKTILLTQRDRVVAEASWEYVQGRGVIP